jgi:hypothetical protein
MSLVPGVKAQDTISRMESRMANTTTVLTDGSRTPAPTARPTFPTLNQNGAAVACGTMCDPCGRTIVGGMERSYLQADVGEEDWDNDVNELDINRDWETGNRGWIGVVGARGLGIRGRYFEYDAETLDSDFITVDTDGNTFEAVYVGTLLDLEAIDIELTQNGCFCGWNTVAALGARYGHIEYDFAGHQWDVEDDSDSDVDAELIHRQFNGVGVTGGLEGRKAIRCGSQLAMYWSARGSAVFGTNEAYNLDIDVDADVDGSVNVELDEDSESEEETLLIGEFQAGFDVSRPIACIRSRVVARVGFEYQVWSLDNVADLDSGETDDPLGQKDLNLYGPVFSIGVTR